ncbi:flavin reductase family protein [Nocardioidaceae bacterium]|nr:flavin reductase family protein [Nocardioidaceae bacterium]
MTIHGEHPFADAGGEKDPARRLRGRLAGRVTLWTSGATARSPDRAGLTMSSVMVATGDPAELLGLVDPDSALGESLEVGSPLAVTVLDWSHRQLADAFAGLTPAPGGPWRLTSWRGEDHPPVPHDASAYALAEVVDLQEVGWSTLVRARLDHLSVREDAEHDPAELVHHRGRYRRLAPPGGS